MLLLPSQWPLPGRSAGPPCSLLRATCRFLPSLLLQPLHAGKGGGVKIAQADGPVLEGRREPTHMGPSWHAGAVLGHALSTL